MIYKFNFYCLFIFLFLVNSLCARKLRIHNSFEDATLSLAKDNKTFGQMKSETDKSVFNFENTKSEIKISAQSSSGLLGIYTLKIDEGTKKIELDIKHNTPIVGDGYQLNVDYVASDYPS